MYTNELDQAEEELLLGVTTILADPNNRKTMHQFDEQLEKFADGRLSSSEMANLAQQVASSPELQQRVTQLSDPSILERLRVFERPMLDESLATIRVGCTEESSERNAADRSMRTIGNYKLMQCIGEGGMGSVWMAEQIEPVKRKVALKLIRTDKDASKAIMARFESERQAIALMEHPNIAKLLDAGATEGGSPYFVMELIRGLPITEYCDTKRLSILDRLTLFQQLCSAIQHAHQKGVIHRDIKPSNVLVESHDGKAVLKVIDFGLAKATSGVPLTERSVFTSFGTVMGTPMYMAPEQAGFNAIDIDTRADIYAMGVVLYELLTGSTPLERDSLQRATLDELFRLVREQEAPRPSMRLSTSDAKPSIAANRASEPEKLGRFLRGELDWIVLKALSKDRDRRYGSASGLSQDIERFLNHEPVQAGPPSAKYRLRKFIRRNWGRVIAATLVILALGIGFAGTLLSLFEAQRQTQIADKAAKLEREARIEANDRRLEAESSERKARVQSQLAFNTMNALITDVQRSLENVSGGTAIRKSLLAKLMPQLDKLSTEFIAKKSLDRTTLLAHRELADSILRLGQGIETVSEPDPKSTPTTTALRLHVNSHEIAKTLASANTLDKVSQRDLMISHERVGTVMWQLGNSEEARSHFENYLKIAQQLVRDNPLAKEAQLDQAAAHEKLADVLQRMGQEKDALEHYQQQMRMNQQLVDMDPSDRRAQRSLSWSLDRIGDIKLLLRQETDAFTHFLQAKEIRQSLANSDPSDDRAQREVAISFANIGDVKLQLEEGRDALNFFEEYMKLSKQLADSDPVDMSAQRDLAIAHERLGRAFLKLEKSQDALDHFQDSIDISQAIANSDLQNAQAQRDLWHAHNNLGDIFLQMKQTQDALEHYDKGMEVIQKCVDSDPQDAQSHRFLMVSHYNRGLVFRDRKLFDEQRSCLKRANDVLDQMILLGLNIALCKQDKKVLDDALAKCNELEAEMQEASRAEENEGDEDQG